MSCDDLPILPPALESIESSSSQQQVVLVTNTTTIPTTNSPTKDKHTHTNTSNSHQNAVQNVMRELADSKEHIDRTVLPSSHNFGGRPCLNMKEFFKLMSERDKKQQNLDALYSLVEHDSDSIIGFVELNGLSFIDEWLDSARKENDYWFSLCILQFLAHDNLYITYQALQTAPIAKAVKQFINPCGINNINNKVLSPQSLPRLTDKIRLLLPNNLNITRANDNFTKVINRQIIHTIVYQNKDIPTIRYLQSQFASRIVNKWKKFVADWKKHNNRPLYRCIRYADEKGKPLSTSSIFHLNDAPLQITALRDKKRREKMITSIKWYHPNKLILIPLFESDNNKYSCERGKDSKEKKIQKERIMSELEEFAIGTENLKNPKELQTNRIINNNNNHIKPTIIPLESEQTSPSPDKNHTLPNKNLHGHVHAQSQPPNQPQPQPLPHPPMQPHSVPYPPPGPYGHGHPHMPGPGPGLPPPPTPYHPHMPGPGPGPYHGHPPPPHYGPPPPHGYPYPYPHPHSHPPPHHGHGHHNIPPPPPYPYTQPPPPQHVSMPQPQAAQVQQQQMVQNGSSGVVNGDKLKDNYRRRDFDGMDGGNVRPNKRQKIHDNRDDNNRYYNDRRHRKRHGRHRNKHDRKHRRGRNGRRNNNGNKNNNGL